MHSTLWFGIIFGLMTMFSPLSANTIQIIHDPGECADTETCNCPCHRCCWNYRCHRCECNPYKRSCVDDEDIEPVPSWPAYWDQPLQEELSR